jgi:hypothetical protein
MRAVGVLHPTENVPLPSDTVTNFLTTASSGQAADWLNSPQVARFTGQSTAGAPLVFQVCLDSTRAAGAVTSYAASGTSAIGGYFVCGQGTFQIPGGSTGYSVACVASAYIQVETWKK